MSTNGKGFMKSFKEDVINKEDAINKLMLSIHPLIGAVNGMDATYYMTFGFINSTIGLADFNSTNCLKLIDVYYTNFTTTFITEFLKGDYTNWVGDTTGIFRNVNPLVESCLWMTNDLYRNYGEYEDAFIFFNQTVLNLGYHFGNVYDHYYEIYNI
jgi:hypothetical protein